MKVVLVLAVLAYWLLSDQDPRPASRAPARAPGDQEYQVGAGSPGNPAFWTDDGLPSRGVGTGQVPALQSIGGAFDGMPQRVKGYLVPAPRIVHPGKPGPGGGFGL